MRRVVLVTAAAAQGHQGALAAAGFEGVTVSSYPEARREVESGAVAVVVCPDAPSWGSEESQVLLAMPPALRRGFVLALLLPTAKTGDGFRAFLLQADLVVNPADASRLGELLRAALAAKRQLVMLMDPEAANKLAG
jgi:ABC-type sugar transport system substrate-binding protein